MYFAHFVASVCTANKHFFHWMAELLDWEAIKRIVSEYDKHGVGIAGQLRLSGLLLFKMGLSVDWEMNYP
jgi:hypothetical protein